MLRFQITGQTELARALRDMPSNFRKDAAVFAMEQAVQPVVDAARANAPVGDTGALRRSIGFVIRKYRNGAVVFGVIGPRRGFGVPDASASTGVTEPANYAHLVEYGHAIAGDFSGWVEAHPFLRPAWDANKGRVEQLLGQTLSGYIAAIAKHGAAKRRRQAVALGAPVI